MPGNNALNVNTDSVNNANAEIKITVRGSDWYWAVTAIMMVATIAFAGMAYTKPRQHRLFHYITAAITMVASIAYFSMASGLGWTGIAVEYQRSDPRVAGIYREIFYVRYIDWVITTPLLLMDLLLTAGMPWPTIMYTILIDEIMIVTGLAGALVRTSYKWGYFVFGCVALAFIVYVLAWEARKHANAMGRDIGRTFLICGSWTAFLWCLYPIAWGVSEGGNVIAPDSEAVFYGILDVMAKPVFGALLIWGHRNIDPAALGLHIHDYDEKDAQFNGKHGAGPVNTNGGVVNETTATPYWTKRILFRHAILAQGPLGFRKLLKDYFRAAVDNELRFPDVDAVAFAALPRNVYEAIDDDDTDDAALHDKQTLLPHARVTPAGATDLLTSIQEIFAGTTPDDNEIRIWLIRYCTYHIRESLNSHTYRDKLGEIMSEHGALGSTILLLQYDDDIDVITLQTCAGCGFRWVADADVRSVDPRDWCRNCDYEPQRSQDSPTDTPCAVRRRYLQDPVAHWLDDYSDADE
nr:hypothetical protein B0A51_00366 [Rachicladosporium sp. CCFEE 5018]